MKDERILRLGVDDIEEIRRYVGWDIPRCYCFKPLPDIGLHCGAQECRETLARLPRQVTEIDLDCHWEGDQ